MAARTRHQAGRPQQVEPQAALQLRQENLQATPPHRERLRSAQRLPAHRDPLRQAGAKLPRLRLPRRRYRMVDLMSLDPKASFNDAKFKAVSFEHPLTTFESAKFRRVPDFRSSSFETPPILHDLHVEYTTTSTRQEDSQDADKYRRLKQLASDAKDYQSELKFFADELRAKRGHETKGRYAIALNRAYGWFSNFGQSVALPFCWLLVLTLVAGVLRIPICWPASWSLDAIVAPFVLALVDAALLIGSDKWAIRDKSLAGLCSTDYGLATYLLAYMQSGVSLVLVFLIGLGLRNRFRMGSSN